MSFYKSSTLWRLYGQAAGVFTEVFPWQKKMWILVSPGAYPLLFFLIHSFPCYYRLMTWMSYSKKKKKKKKGTKNEKIKEKSKLKILWIYYFPLCNFSHRLQLVVFTEVLVIVSLLRSQVSVKLWSECF